MPNSYIQINAIEDNNQITLFIKDNGIGIPKSDIPNVFKNHLPVLMAEIKSNQQAWVYT